MNEHDKSFAQAASEAIKRDKPKSQQEILHGLAEGGEMVAAYYVGLIRGGMPEGIAESMAMTLNNKIMDLIMQGAEGKAMARQAARGISDG